MLPKVLRTIFLALGLAMIWLGCFYQYTLKKQPVAVQEPEVEEEPFYGELELYTLADDNYTEGEEALSGLELMPLHITDFSVSLSSDESLSSETEQQQELMVEKDAVTAIEAEAVQVEQHVQEAGIGRFPLALAAAGAFFLFCGVLSCRFNKEL